MLTDTINYRCRQYLDLRDVSCLAFIRLPGVKEQPSSLGG
jgi:hypothetical protein